MRLFAKDSVCNGLVKTTCHVVTMAPNAGFIINCDISPHAGSTTGFLGSRPKQVLRSSTLAENMSGDTKKPDLNACSTGIRCRWQNRVLIQRGLRRGSASGLEGI